METRAKRCLQCQKEFWSGMVGVISPFSHNWFHSEQCYADWWRIQHESKTVETNKPALAQRKTQPDD